MDINSKDLINRFCEYVKIDSESHSELNFCDRVFEDLCELGYDPKKFAINSDYKTDGYNIYFYKKGTLDGDPVLLNAHLDTVCPGKNIEPVIEKGIIKSGGPTILGADDKTAVTCIVEALKCINEKKLDHRSFEVLFTVGEEVGLQGVSAFDLNLIKSRIAYTLDSSNPVGTMIFAAPSNYQMDIKIHGKTAHAGRVPEKGISAIQVAAKAISKIPLLRVDDDTVCNIGTFESHFETNVVPDFAHLTAMARSNKQEKLDELVRCIEKTFIDECKKYGAQLEFNKLQRYKAYQKYDKDASVRFVSEKMIKLGLEPHGLGATGGSDAHHLNACGFDALNLGIGNQNVHSENECIETSQLEKTALLVQALLCK